MKTDLRLEILPQPDDTTCGPTCLHALYRFYGDEIPLDQLVGEVVSLGAGGTLAVHLACHALRKGFPATIYTYNLEVFDPSWFGAANIDLAERLAAQAAYKDNAKLREATGPYLEYLALGGRILYQELRPSLIRRWLLRNHPILTGLSATYLYGCAREAGEHKLHYDDVRGRPMGHFVVLCGYDRPRREVLIADPLQENPRFGGHYYAVGMQRLLGAILLGVLTYDANLLVIGPRHRQPRA